MSTQIRGLNFVQQERLVEYYSPERRAQRSKQREYEQNRTRQSRQIESVVEHTANLLREQGARCFEVAKKGSGIIDGIDLSQWHGTDGDLSLLRVFLSLEDDNRENRHNNRFTLIMGPSTTDASLAYLKDLTNLADLSIQNVPITDVGLKHLQTLTRLDRVDLTGARITDSGLESFSNCPYLWRINVSGTDVTFAGMAKFSQLRPSVEVMFNQGVLHGGDLDLAGYGGQHAGLNRKDAGMSLAEVLGGLTKCRQFRSISLHRSNATNADLEILEWQTELEQLFLSETSIGDDGLKHLAGLTGLERLGLSKTKVTDVGLECLRGLTELELLSLNDTQITDDGLKCLAGLTKLTCLYLDTTQVTDAGLPHLRGLTELTHLGLSGTRVTDAGIEYLKELTRLRELHLDDTQVTDVGLETLRTLSQLELLWLGIPEMLSRCKTITYRFGRRTDCQSVHEFSDGLTIRPTAIR